MFIKLTGQHWSTIKFLLFFYIFYRIKKKLFLSVSYQNANQGYFQAPNLRFLVWLTKTLFRDKVNEVGLSSALSILSEYDEKKLLVIIDSLIHTLNKLLAFFFLKNCICSSLFNYRITLSFFIFGILRI